jgi:amino acid adenylation domain-containing protein
MNCFPLSISQQGIWFLSQIDKATSAAYNMVYAFEASKKLDEVILLKTLEVLAHRHEMLRSCVKSIAGVPQFQIISVDEVPRISIRISSKNIATVALDESAVPIDLSKQPLYRVVLVEPNDVHTKGWGVVFTFTHLAFDATSATVFFEDLSRVYGEIVANKKTVFNPLTADFQTITRLEKDFVSTESGQLMVQSAVKRLGGIPERLVLPRNRPVTEGRLVYPAAVVKFYLSAPQTNQVHKFAKHNRVTPAAIYLGVFQLLLWRYSGQSDFGVSIPVTNRGMPGSEHLIGYLTNLGIVRSSIDSHRSVKEFFVAVTDQLLDLLDSSQLAFPVLAKQMKRGGQDIQGPLLQVGFNHVSSERREYQVGPSELRIVETLPHYVKNEFKLDIHEFSEGARCWFLYDREGFDAAFIGQMVGHYQILLEGVIADSQAKLKDLPLLSEAEREQVLVEWNDTKADFPSDKCIHQLFEEQVEKRPEAVAVIFEDQQLTYGELNAKANQLAHYLRELGVKPDTLVAICVERSLEMVIGLLGILKAGGAYVPLDPDYPKERLAFMLQDTAAPVLLMQEHLKDKLPKHIAREVRLDADWNSISQHPTTNPDNVTLPQHLAYCIYTSGSTGRPKGAVNMHQGFVNLVHWYFCQELGTQSTERVMLASSLGFDLTQKNVLGSIVSGATLIIPPGTITDIDNFRVTVEKHQPTRINCAPSAYQAYQGAASASSLCTVILGGEPIEATLVAELSAKQIVLVNSYGPTECADVAISYLNRPGKGIINIPLGWPISNVQVFILDEALNPIPIGVAGEIYIAGVGVSRGYLNRPDLTAERFIPHSFGEPGGRMYKTGDVGRYLSDGSIEFLGRIDQQVKIRGFRIELGEIESMLLIHPCISQTVVTAREDSPGDKRLVAYVVTKEKSHLTVNNLRAHLQKNLPEYMVPAAWVFLDTLPLNPNGKIDRKALPMPELSRPDFGMGYVAPHTLTEELLVSIWTEVLNVSKISVHDNFFVLGGHSLLATRVAARIKDFKAVTIPMRTIFEFPTISMLSLEVEKLTATGIGNTSVQSPIKRQPRAGDG